MYKTVIEKAGTTFGYREAIKNRIRAIGLGTYLSMHATTKMTLIRQDWDHSLHWNQMTRKRNKREKKQG